MRILITIASTGRLMEISLRTTVSLLLWPPLRSAALLRYWAARRRCRGRGRQHRDRGAVLDLDLAVGDDHRLGVETGEDFDLTGAALAHLDLGQRGLAVDHLVDEGVLALRPDRLLGNQHGVGPALEQHRHAREHAGTQLPPLVRHAGTQQDGAGFLVDHWLDRIDLSGESLARVGVYAYADLLAGLHFGQVMLRHAEIELDRGDVFEAHDIVALLHIGARADHPYADHAAEWRIDIGALDAHLVFAHARLGALELVARNIERILAHELLGEQ